jgi:DNA-binding NarL/FixJ family response regulator
VIRVLLVDDQELVRTGFRMILEHESDLTVVGECPDGAAAVRLCRDLRPDVVLMDIRMPVMDGIEATRRLLEEGTAIRVLVLTTFDLDDLVFAALDAGASGFLLKDVRASELAHAIRTVACGESLLAPTVTRRLINHFVALQRSAAPPRAGGEAISSLTPREREVLVLLARGLSNAEIAAAFVVTEATVKTHIGRVFDKLAVRDRAQAVITAYETGLVSPGG